LVEEALAANWPFRFVFHTDELSARGVTLLERIQEHQIQAEEVERGLLASISDTENSQGILAVLDYRPIAVPQAVDFALIVDGIREPGNLGTLLRTADAAGVQRVMLAPESVDAFAPKVVRAGMGAHFRLPMQSMDWPQIGALVDSMNLSLCLADMHGTVYWEADFRRPLALVIGGEAGGASEQARTAARQTVSIPMQGKAESLNAAVAGSILMFEVVRQRNGRG